ncbi:hypothetical protein [Sphingosinicella sp. CPCC 101087]|uniref:hypothetical protein n=1 Tax=Sphingosinicella sp. CPCC 101087 TaxID=2497754 RepID=UPI00101D4811|nr:hypothetical protein [Sphingosinicella sp. CPCC 101087]
MHWYEFKEYLSKITDLDQDALHVYAAVLLHIAAAGLLRRTLASIIPWLAVLAVLVLNEWSDLREPGGPIEEWQVIGGLKDIWNTMAIPTILLLLGRYSPWLVTDRGNYPSPEGSRSR